MRGGGFCIARAQDCAVSGVVGIAGSVTVATSPLPSWGASSTMLPCEACTISRTMARPRPEPGWSGAALRQKRSNTRSRTSAGMPGPLSLMLTMTWPRFFSSPTVTLPPSGVQRRALSMRFISMPASCASLPLTTASASVVSMPRSMPFFRARPASSSSTVAASATRSTGPRGKALLLEASACESSSSLLVRSVMLRLPSCSAASTCASRAGSSIWRANWICESITARGVRNWCAASATKRFCTVTWAFKRCMYWLMASTMGLSSTCRAPARRGVSELGSRAASASLIARMGRNSMVRPSTTRLMASSSRTIWRRSEACQISSMVCWRPCMVWPTETATMRSVPSSQSARIQLTTRSGRPSKSVVAQAGCKAEKSGSAGKSGRPASRVSSSISTWQYTASWAGEANSSSAAGGTDTTGAPSDQPTWPAIMRAEASRARSWIRVALEIALSWASLVDKPTQTAMGISSHHNSRRRRLSIIFLLQQVTQAAQGHDGRAGGLQLLAQARDVDLDGVGAGLLGEAEDPLHQRRLGHGLALLEHEHFQHVMFARRQGQGGAGHGELARVAVIDQVAAVDLGGLVGGLAAHQDLDAGHQLAYLEGFDQVVVGARTQALDLLVDGAAGGQDHDRHAVVALAQPAQHVLAAQLGQHQVQQHDVVVLVAQDLVGDLAIGGDIDLELVFLEDLLQPVGELGIVFDQEQFHAVLLGVFVALQIKKPFFGKLDEGFGFLEQARKFIKSEDGDRPSHPKSGDNHNASRRSCVPRVPFHPSSQAGPRVVRHRRRRLRAGPGRALGPGGRQDHHHGRWHQQAHLPATQAGREPGLFQGRGPGRGAAVAAGRGRCRE
eukprot:TRINITY_DN12717_c0_g1_i1.p1 TRINITY_DN12717_c0_g1~~TRINITY_DN12717_c0_g1_i1.p1  ORF type:complete len:841 (-),score=269.53 TRINITY_DN12717_c0_g1_i1:1757-4279(-)